VPVLLAQALPFRKVEESDPGVVEEGLQGCSCRVFDTITDDEDLDLCSFLSESAADCIGEQGGMPMCGNEDRRVDHAAGLCMDRDRLDHAPNQHLAGDG